MAYKLEDINLRTVSDPKGFVEECDAHYQKLVDDAAERIIENRARSPIVLLAGPSGSGKTTTSMKIAEALEKRGIHMHYVAMDDYFKTVDHTTPRTPEGELDLESPLCLDMDLLNNHFTQLAEGKRVYVPKYEFSRRMRIQEPSKSIKLRGDDMVIFEGIHAFNSMITDVHPEAFKLYISARSNVEFDEKIVFKRSWFRLVRRMVRDFKFRGRREYAYTLALLMAQAYVRQRGDLPPCDAVTWTPVSLLRRLSRGYDQSRLLAEALGKLLDLPVVPALRKRRHTRRQSGIGDPGKRAENVRGVYTVREAGNGRHVLLTDDVITTGATLREAAEVLQAAGWRCTALCFACTPEKL